MSGISLENTLAVPGPLDYLTLDKHDPDLISSWNQTIQRGSPELNKAWLQVKSAVDGDVDVYTQSAYCVKCPLWKEGTLKSRGIITFMISTITTLSLAITDDKKQIICSGQYDFQERGDYWLVINETNSQRCSLSLQNKPPNIYLPLLWACLFLFCVAVIFCVFIRLHNAGTFRRCRPGYTSKDLPQTIEMSKDSNRKSSTDHQNEGGNPIAPAKAPASKRVQSLDTFRGLSLLVMIFVNYGGGGYYFFQHAPWNGLMIADLVFPWFIFIMGTSMELSFTSMVKHETPKWRMIWHIVRRSALLFLIGISLTTMWGNDLRKLRIPGVLQRFGVSYLIVGLLHVFFVRIHNQKQRHALGDLYHYWFEWIFMLCLLTLHLGFTFGLPVPGCPTGYLGPGGLHEGGQYYNCTGGAAGYIDRLLLGNIHIFQWPTIRSIYYKGDFVPFDPEGILGCLTSAFMCFLGLQAGKILCYFPDHKNRLNRLMLWGLVCGAIGLILSHAKQEEGWIPINKNLWSTSYIFLLSGMAYLLLFIFYIGIDILQYWNGAPMIYLGMNSLAIYCCHEIFHGYFPVRWQMPDPSLHWQQLFMAMWGTGVWVLTAYVLYCKKIFIAL